MKKCKYSALSRNLPVGVSEGCKIAGDAKLMRNVDGGVCYSHEVQ